MIEPIETLGILEPGTTSSVFRGVRLSTRIMPAALAARGGDWCETFAVSEDVVALSIGDVCGHGAEKFTAMGKVRQTIRDAACRGLDPLQVLAVTNRFLRRYDPEENATAILALLNVRQRSLVFANAGHPPPLMAGPFGVLFLEYPEADFPLGIMAEIAPALHVVSVPAATLLVFYTDGVSEHGRKPIEGESQLRDAAMFAYKASHLASAAVIERQMFLTGSNLDDAAILAAWTLGAPIMRGKSARHERVKRLHVLDGSHDVGVVRGGPKSE
jgi:serine phosphatase RsbU (regulator of sigma subunit)